jgi:hypothetical protein
MGAPEEMLKDMLAAKDETSPLITRLRKLDLDNDVIGVAVLEPYRDLARQALEAADLEKVPPQLHAVRNLPDQLEAVTVTFNLSEERFLGVELEAKNAEASKEVFQLAEETLTVVKAVYQTALQKGLGKTDPELANLATETAKGFVKGIELRHDAPRVFVRVRAPSTVGDLATKLGPLMVKGVQGP